MPTVKSSKNMVAIKQIRFLTDHTFVLRLDRTDFNFKPGQHLTLGVNNSLQHREYSIYSGDKDDYLEILVREILEGDISVQLKNVQVGQPVEINGPFGILRINEEDLPDKKFILIATGTGIAPFHSFVRSYKNMDYTIIHGVKYSNEAYEKSEYDFHRYVLCTSREKKEGFQGRVTDYLRKIPVTPDMRFYICGNSKMIYEVYSILRNKGVQTNDIFSEVYF